MRSFPGKGIFQRAIHRASHVSSRLAAPFRHCDISIFHDFSPPPTGGGHQFLRALKREWERRGFRVEINSVSRSTRACLLNSYNFDAERFLFLRRAGCRTVHRVDGPLSAYRGYDDGTDRRIEEWNREFAQGTVIQSQFSLKAHFGLGLIFRNPVVIPNAADPEIFYPPEWPVYPHGRKLRVISTSWSDNPNKGTDIYKWLDRNLDFGRIEYTFVGRLSAETKNIRVMSPISSHELADLLRASDVYLTASLNDPCSNSLIEALSCGLPAIYRRSGGHPELVGRGGQGFDSAGEIPALLDQMMETLGEYRNNIHPPRITDVADQYLSVLGVMGKVQR